MNRIILAILLGWAVSLIAAEVRLLGLIYDGSRSVGVFEFEDEISKVLRKGEGYGEYQVMDISENGAVIRKGEDMGFIRKGGRKTFKEQKRPEPSKVDYDHIEPEMEIIGTEVNVTQEYRDFIRGEGLMEILFQASATPIYNSFQDCIGFEITNIEPNSVYEIGGLQEGDIVEAIDGTWLTGPLVAISALNRAKDLDEFSVTISRNGKPLILNIHVK